MILLDGQNPSGDQTHASSSPPPYRPPESERADLEPTVVASTDKSPTRFCAYCGTPLRGRQRSACSGRCRAAWSRRRREQEQRDREGQLRKLLDGALRLLSKSENNP